MPDLGTQLRVKVSGVELRDAGWASRRVRAGSSGRSASPGGGREVGCGACLSRAPGLQAQPSVSVGWLCPGHSVNALAGPTAPITRSLAHPDLALELR